jgi:hypothetical protein
MIMCEQEIEEELDIILRVPFSQNKFNKDFTEWSHFHGY